jgi:hypothetical protein
LLVKYISGNAPAMPKESKPLSAMRGGDPPVDRCQAPWPAGGTQTEKPYTKSRVRIFDANTLQLEDGTKYRLTTVAPELDQMGLINGRLYPAGREAAECLRRFFGDQPVLSFDKIAYVGDKNIHELVVYGWAMHQHSSTALSAAPAG